jgi:hypothetical protein
MGKVLTDADFGIKNTATGTNDNAENEPIVDGGDLETPIGDVAEVTVEDPNKGKGKKKVRDGLIFDKYETMEEAGKAFKESERKMHEATERAARLERDQSTRVKTDPEVDPGDTIADEALVEIGKLNPEDPDYQKKTARIWAKAQMKIANLTVGKAKEAETSTKSTEERVSSALKDAKLPSDNDKKIFWSIASHCPADIKDLEGQISWTIERVQEVKADVAKEMVEEANRKKKEKGDLKVLGRKGSKTTSSEEEEENKSPMTLVEQLKASRRRV